MGPTGAPGLAMQRFSRASAGPAGGSWDPLYAGQAPPISVRYATLAEAPAQDQARALAGLARRPTGHGPSSPAA